MTDDVASLQIRVLTDQVEVGNRRLSALEQTGAKAERALDKVSKVNFGVVMSALAGVGISLGALTALGAQSTRQWLEYDKAIKEVNSITAQTNKEFVQMRRDVLNLSTALGVDATKAARGLYQALSAGVPKENSIKFLETATKAAIAGVSDVETSVDGLTNVINAYKMPVEEAEAISDKLFATVVNGKTTFSELASEMSKASVPAASLGVPLEELLGTIVGITKQGTPTSEAFTQVKATIQALTDPSEELLAVYKEMGVESGRTAIAQYGFIETLNRVQQAYSGNDAALVKALRSSEAYNGVLSVTGRNLAEVKKGTDAVRNSAGMMGSAYTTNANTLENALASLKSSAIGLVETMEGSLGVIASFTEALRGAAQAISALANTDVSEGTANALSAGDSIVGANNIRARIKELEELRKVQGEALKEMSSLQKASTLTPIGALVAGNQIGDFKQTIRELEQLREAQSKLSKETVLRADAVRALTLVETDLKSNKIDESEALERRAEITKELNKELTVRQILNEQTSRAAKLVEEEAAAEKKRQLTVTQNFAKEQKLLEEKNKQLEEIAKRAKELATTERERIQLEAKGIDEAFRAGKISEEVHVKAKANLEEQIRLLDERNAKTGGGGGGGAAAVPLGLSAIEQSLTDISDPFGATDPYEYLREQEEEIRESYQRRMSDILSLTGITEDERNALVADSQAKYIKILGKAQDERNALTLRNASDFFGNLASIASAFGKKGHKVAQAAAIAQATIDMYASAVGAYKSLVGTPYIGPYIAPVAAAAAVAAGAANIAKIKSTSYSGEYEHGGLIPSGKYGLVGEAGAELVQGPANVISARTTAAMMSGGSDNSSAPIINIYNYAGVEVETKQTDRADKQKEIDIIIRKAVESVAGSIRTGVGSVPKALEQTYPLNRGQI